MTRRQAARYNLRKVRQHGRAAGPQPARPAGTPLEITYRVHVRNTEDAGRGSWATYVTAVREAAGLTKTHLAARLGVDRGTIHRWESGVRRPESAELVAAFADLFDLDRDEALTAAGFRPGGKPPEQPVRQRPPLVQWILDQDYLSEDEKAELVKRELERIEREQRQRIEELKWMLATRRRNQNSA